MAGVPVDEHVSRYGEIDSAIEARAEVLLARMTLAEKVGQLSLKTPFVIPEPAEISTLIEPYAQRQTDG